MKRTIARIATLVVMFLYIGSTNLHAAGTCRRPAEVLAGDKLKLQNQIIDRYEVPRVVYRESKDPTIPTILGLAAQGRLVKLPEAGPGFELGSIGKSRYKSYPYPDDLKYVHPGAFAMNQRISELWLQRRRDTRLRVNSGIRTPKWHGDVKRKNKNAASGASPDHRTAHLSGLPLDYTKLGLEPAEVCDLWAICMLLQAQNLVLCVDERVENNVHIFAFPDFASRAYVDTRFVQHSPMALGTDLASVIFGRRIGFQILAPSIP